VVGAGVAAMIGGTGSNVSMSMKAELGDGMATSTIVVEITATTKMRALLYPITNTGMEIGRFLWNGPVSLATNTHSISPAATNTASPLTAVPTPFRSPQANRSRQHKTYLRANVERVFWS
jgi:hypothetical protein